LQRQYYDFLSILLNSEFNRKYQFTDLLMRKIVSEVFKRLRLFSSSLFDFPIPSNYINPPINAIISYREPRKWDLRERTNRNGMMKRVGGEEE
jgi:hypothetical protein